jgi:uncharacterized Zn-binding protein involved in type VI secretion
VSGGPSLPAARKGDRITHHADLDDSSVGGTLGAALGALVAEVGHAGAMAAQIGAGLASSARDAAGKIKMSLRTVTAHQTSGQIEDGSADTFLGGPDLPAALVAAQKIDCHHHRDKPIQKGSVSVFVNGKLLARASDPTACGAMICDGAQTVLIGGAPADGAPPAPLAIAAKNAAVTAVNFAHAIAAGVEDAIGMATRYGTELVDSAVALEEHVVARVENAGAAIEKEIKTDVGQLVGVVNGASLSSLLGGALSDGPKS